MAPDSPAVNATPGSSSASGGLWDTDQSPPPADEIVRSQALLQLLSMLRDEYGDTEDDRSDDMWEDVDEE